MTDSSSPVTDADLVGMRVGHRAMRADLHRLTATVADLAHGAVPSTRAHAVADYVDLLVTSIENHHRNEDDYLWPVLRHVAVEHIDLGELVEDHTELESMLQEARRWATKLHPGEPDALSGLAEALAQLRDLLDEHINDEEQAIFPLITGYIDQKTWVGIEKQARKGAQLDFEGPRVIAVTTPQERDQLGRKYKIMVRVVLPVLRRQQRRRERAVFGSAPMPLRRFIPDAVPRERDPRDPTRSNPRSTS
ncbi:MAG TPA: hemerythrin domain-containing protein [Aldersonia sp.]